MPLEDQCSALSYVSNLQSLMQRASSKYTLLRIAGSIAMMKNLNADQDAQSRTLFSITVFLIKLAKHVMMYITNKHRSENSGHC